jgi:hypothetical protein
VNKAMAMPDSQLVELEKSRLDAKHQATGSQVAIPRQVAPSTNTTTKVRTASACRALPFPKSGHVFAPVKWQPITLSRGHRSAHTQGDMLHRRPR